MVLTLAVFSSVICYTRTYKSINLLIIISANTIILAWIWITSCCCEKSNLYIIDYATKFCIKVNTYKWNKREKHEIYKYYGKRAMQLQCNSLI